MKASIVHFIMETGDPWLQYAVKQNVIGESKESLADLRDMALADPKIETYLHDITNFHSTLVSNHKNPDLPIHKLLFLLSLGFDADVPAISTALKQIMEHRDSNGVYQSLTNIPKHFGGSGEDIFGWCLCDAPLLLYALHKAGIAKEHVKPGVEFLLKSFAESGFPCTVSQEFGRFRGPGRKSDQCPYASLMMLKLLSTAPEYRGGEVAKATALGLLSLWENSMERHPYMFYMGTDFRKLKAPMMWYDILSVVDVLSYFECAKQDARFLEMVSIVREKQDENGLYTPESIFQKFKGWDFGQKKKPSPYLTYLCHGVLDRVC